MAIYKYDFQIHEESICHAKINLRDKRRSRGDRLFSSPKQSIPKLLKGSL